MNFNEEIDKYNSLNKEEKIKKVKNIIQEIKDWDEYLTEIFTTLEKLTLDKINIKTIDYIYKILLEAMVFQNKILDTDKKEKLKKIEEKLKIQLNIEKKEKEKEKIELEKLLNF